MCVCLCAQYCSPSLSLYIYTDILIHAYLYVQTYAVAVFITYPCVSLFTGNYVCWDHVCRLGQGRADSACSYSDHLRGAAARGSSML